MKNFELIRISQSARYEGYYNAGTEECWIVGVKVAGTAGSSARYGTAFECKGVDTYIDPETFIECTREEALAVC